MSWFHGCGCGLQDMIIICNEEISKLRKLEESEGRGGQGARQRGSVNVSVADDVASVFKGKTVS